MHKTSVYLCNGIKYTFEILKFLLPTDENPPPKKKKSTAPADARFVIAIAGVLVEQHVE